MRLNANKQRLRREAYDSLPTNNDEKNPKSNSGYGEESKTNLNKPLEKLNNAPGTIKGAFPPSVPPSLSGDSKIGSGCSMI